MYRTSFLVVFIITLATNFTVGENSINRHQIEFPVSAVEEMESESQNNLFFGLYEINQPVLQERDLDFKLLSAKMTIELKNVDEVECFSGNTKEDNKAKSSLIVLSHLLGPAWSQFFQTRLESNTYSTFDTEEKNIVHRSYGSCSSEIHSLCIGFNELKTFEPITNEILKLDSFCSNTSETKTLTVDLTPVIQMWISKQHQIMYEGPKLFSEMIVFSLVVDHIMDSSRIAKTSRIIPTNKFVGNHLPMVWMDYIINRNCYTIDKVNCSSDVNDLTCEKDVQERICKFRPNCPQNKCGISCDFEEPCDWEWKRQEDSEETNGFQLLSGQQVMETRFQMQDPQFGYSGPHYDGMNNTDGHFLVLIFTKKPDQTKAYHITSPWFQESESSCYIEGMLHMHNMNDGTFKLLLHKEHTTWVPLSGLGNDNNMWQRFQRNIGKTEKPFRVAIEIIPSSKYPSHIAIDNLKFVDCFRGVPSPNCTESEFHCQSKFCINRSQICDFTKDCPNGEEETGDCEKMPLNTTCNFEKDQCGWTGSTHSSIKWERTNKRAPKEITGPQAGDHTFHHLHNFSGYYMLVDMNAKHSNLLDRVVLNSTYYAPPPSYHKDPNSKFYNSCQLRFYYHMFGPHMGSLHVDIIEVRPNQFHKSTRLLAISGDQGNHWLRESRSLPKLESLYYIEFVATRGVRFAGNIALDDVSLSPECVGLGVPQKELKGYDYVTLRNRLIGNLIIPPRPPLKNITKYVLTTCNNHGREGPTPELCENAYSQSQTDLNSSVTVLTEEGKSGIQVWQVPESRHYTLIAKGASGGRGAVSNDMRSRASVVKASFFLQKGEEIYVLVGQEGASVCDQITASMPRKLQSICKKNAAPLLSAVEQIARASKVSLSSPLTAVKEMTTILGGGGGGGGATYVYKMDGETHQPLLVAAGGGGLAYTASTSISPYGRGTNLTLDPMCGSSFPHGAGGGGGWKGTYVPSSVEAVKGLNDIKKYFGPSQNDTTRDNITMWISAGQSLIDGGGIGGLPCIDSENWGTVGGFGGGGGGCTAGGGGGGYVGGSAHNGVASNGEGGISYITKGGLIPSIEPGNHDGPGSLVILPSIAGELCGCEYQCLLLDDENFQSTCVCPSTKVPGDDGKSCVERETTIPLPYLIGIVLVGIVAFACVGLLCIFLYNRYQRRKAADLRRKVVGGPELQLSRLRAASGPSGVLTEYNPNYEFGGETYTLTDLKEIPRENLRLVKALGQGAFGEVYQGFYKQRTGDAVEMPVAVKTLPELSSNQAEMDFLMEALIMSKFSHPNIVHFIGVCFDKHPRFIILELLAGGDLKTFLRESRPKPDRPSPLTMRDLLLCAVDIAKGCRYLEENHFIHRDIAARNCLLTTKGPGRVVKIADFGMARDIYRADYYKKGGKAMLPVKWMPPEAFLDGIFTSKTDVWSYGVLLWEVVSLGYMPYPGRGNQDVMQLVTNGGRLEPPSNCPPPVYGIMTQCWHPIPEERPTFATLLERVGYCLQDPEVVNSPLPVFQRPPSSERDTTVMRPNSDESCLRIVQGHRSSNSTLSTVPPSPGSAMADYLIPLTPYSMSSSSNRGDSTVTSPTSPLPESESAQTLLEETEDEDTITKDNILPGSAKASETTQPPHQPRYVSKKPSTIGNGLTLNASNLENSIRAPTTYANVGVKKSKNNSDLDEIRC